MTSSRTNPVTYEYELNLRREYNEIWCSATRTFKDSPNAQVTHYNVRVFKKSEPGTPLYKNGKSGKEALGEYWDWLNH